jgi:hypothetical protein
MSEITHAAILVRMDNMRSDVSRTMMERQAPSIFEFIWWSQTGSNRRPHACKARALPAELWPRNQKTNAKRLMKVVGLGRLELPTSRLSSARSNQLSYKPLHEELHAARSASADTLHSAAPGACSSAKKEKRRRRNPANGAQQS